MAIFKKDEKQPELPPLTAKEHEIFQQLCAARRERSNWEKEWASNEASLFDIGAEGGILRGPYAGYPLSDASEEIDKTTEQDAVDNFIGVNISDRNRQFIVSQLIGNVPVVMAAPTSNEVSDIDSAEAAELTTTYMRQFYHLDDVHALWYNTTSVYGTGFVKTLYKGDKGTLVYNGNNTFTTLGDLHYSIPRIWDMFLDINANRWSESRFITERIWPQYSDALKFFGDEVIEMLNLYRVNDVVTSSLTIGDTASLLHELKHDVVEVYERWETGTEDNDWEGRLIYHLKDGRVLKAVKSPCAFRYKSGMKQAKKIARLPYSCLTYEDIPNNVYGRSPATKVARAQHVLNACYMVRLSTAQSMGMPRLVCDIDALGENKDEAIANDSVKVIPLSLGGTVGGTMPFVLQAASTSPDIKDMTIDLSNYINDAWGVTDALLGKVGRETQGIMMQLSIMQGNAIRERVFQKFLIEGPTDIYELSLDYAVEYWKAERLIQIAGENNKRKAKMLKGSDLVGGYVLHIERGNGFALDPITRQEQIIQLAPIFEKAGVDSRYLLRQLKAAALRGMYDKFDMADNRAKAVIDAIKAGEEVLLFKYEDHLGVASYIEDYIMTEEFMKLPPKQQQAIEQHIDKRYTMEASKRTPAPVSGRPAPQQQQLTPEMLTGGLPPGPPKIGPM